MDTGEIEDHLLVIEGRRQRVLTAEDVDPVISADRLRVLITNDVLWLLVTTRVLLAERDEWHARYRELAEGI